MPIDDGFPNHWPEPRTGVAMWDYEGQIPEVIAGLYQWIDILKELDHSKARREHERDLCGGRWSQMEKALISLRSGSDYALNLIRIVDGYPEKPPFIRTIEKE